MMFMPSGIPVRNIRRYQSLPVPRFGTASIHLLVLTKLFQDGAGFGGDFNKIHYCLTSVIVTGGTMFNIPGNTAFPDFANILTIKEFFPRCSAAVTVNAFRRDIGLVHLGPFLRYFGSGTIIIRLSSKIGFTL
jgi:hypothetical protein